jgi:acyl carrier protein
LHVVRDAPVTGAVPELDSMAVVSLITTLEECFDFTISEDKFDRSSLEAVGALTDFVMSEIRA